MIPAESSPGAPEQLHTLVELLDSVGADSIEQFSARVHDDQDVDTWVWRTRAGILVETSTGSIELDFPFTWPDFWDAVEDLEQDFLARH